MRDLELRGAGNLLGDEQSGHVAALGFELYMQMLDEAVREMDPDEEGAEQPEPVRLDINVDAYVPADYIPYEQAKVDVHRRIAGARENSRADGAARRARGPLRRDPGAAREPDHARSRRGSSSAARARRRSRSRAAGWRSRRSSWTPRRRAVCARSCPGANYEAGRSQLSLRVPDDPAQRFPAVVRAADALLSVQARCLKVESKDRRVPGSHRYHAQPGEGQFSLAPGA